MANTLNLINSLSTIRCLISIHCHNYKAARSTRCAPKMSRSSPIRGIPRTGHVRVHVSDYILDDLHWLPFQQLIIFRICPGLEVSAGPCTGLPTSSMLSHNGHQRLQLPQLKGTRILFVPFARTSTRQTRAFSVVGPLCGMGFH